MKNASQFNRKDIPKSWRIVPFWSLFKRTKKTGFAQEELLSVYRDYGVIPKSSRDDNHNKESEDSNLFDSVTEAETWIPLADDDEEEPIIDSSL